METFSYPDPTTLPDAMRPFWTRGPNATRMLMGASPEVFQAVAALGKAVYVGTPLSPRLREIAVLRVGVLLDCPYELFQHEGLARGLGMTDQELAAIRSGSGDALGADGAVVMRLTDEIVRDWRPSADALAAVRALASQAEVLDLLLTIGNYLMLCCFLNATGVRIDDPIDWSKMFDGSP